MTEMFVAVGDALERSLLRVVHVALKDDKLPDLPRPGFLPPPPPPSRAAARAAMDALIAKGRRH